MTDRSADIEAVARAIAVTRRPKLFSDDEQVAHRAASPFMVEAVRASELDMARKQATAAIEALRPIHAAAEAKARIEAYEDAAGKEWAKWQKDRQVFARLLSEMLPENVVKVLNALGAYDDFGYYSFQDIADSAAIPRDDVKPAINCLKALALVVFGTGLCTEDGDFRGSGYALSADGGEVKDAIEDYRIAAAILQGGEKG